MLTKYICHFGFSDEPRKIESEEGLCAFKNGFWITGKLKLTKGKDCQFWIPPSKIHYI